MTNQVKPHYWLPQALYELRLALNEKICDETLRKIKVSEPVDCMYAVWTKILAIPVLQISWK